MTIALAGNPNSGKTTLFNALTGANQYVGNWPGVTVEKKTGKLKSDNEVSLVDLPGIYSLSPYTEEEVVARNFLIDEDVDVILNIVDATNIERNLYLTTQLRELGIPVVVALNFMDVVEKSGVVIDSEILSKELGIPVLEISASKGENVDELAELAIASKGKNKVVTAHSYSGPVEHALAHIEEVTVHGMNEEKQRWYAIKLFERDEEVRSRLGLSQETIDHIEQDIRAAEEEIGDTSESIITNERYNYVVPIVKKSKDDSAKEKSSVTQQIDNVVTNKWLALPIFAIVMFLIFSIAMVWIGKPASDWVNDKLFGDGFFINAQSEQMYIEASEKFAEGQYADKIEGYTTAAEKAGIDTKEVSEAAATLAEKPQDRQANQVLNSFVQTNSSFVAKNCDTFDDEGVKTGETIDVTSSEFKEAVLMISEAPDPASYDGFVPSLGDAARNWLESIESPAWLVGLVVDGIIGGVGAVLGFVPQLMVLFLCLAFVEECGYMSRVAFVLDRVFRKFGLSGKSVIPMLIATGCGVPAVMSTRTIEELRERRITIMTTTMIPCNAKIPIISLIAGAIIGGEFAALISTGAYFGGILAILLSGIFLKRLRMFAGEVSPFVMELPQYHMPKLTAILKTMWDRSWSFIKKAGTVILLSTIVIWFLTYFGFVEGEFRMLDESEIDSSILAVIGNAVCWIFAPLGFGEWQTTVTTLTGLVAKENLVSTMAVIYGGNNAVNAFFTAMLPPAALAFLAFNLLCAPCFAAMGAIKREMNNARWFWFAIGYQCGFAYFIALLINQIGNIVTGNFDYTGVVVLLIAIVALIIWKLIDKKKKGINSCGCGCDGCSMKGECHS